MTKPIQMTAQALKDELAGLDQLIHSEASYYGTRDLIMYDHLQAEAVRRGFYIGQVLEIKIPDDYECEQCGDYETWKNSSGELQCDSCGYSESDE